MSGKLYLCATPIGNLEDITYRVVRTLKEADIIAAEDTRNTLRLLNHFDIHTPLTSYHANNRIQKARELVDRLAEGKDIALVTDAGTPGISDPGEDLVRMCHEAGIEVTSLPGASALVTAVSLSGMDCSRFCFEAFLPRDKGERKALLKELGTQTCSIVIYEAPHRLEKTLRELNEELGDRQICICRELTKIHEEVRLTTLSAAAKYYEKEAPRGEFVLIIAGRNREELVREEQSRWMEMSLNDHMKIYEDKGLERLEAMKAVARDRGVGKRDIYRQLLEEEVKE